MANHDHILINWVQLSDHFRSLRGTGVGYRTIQKWQVQGMPYIREGKLIFYQWDDCLEWYLDRFSIRRVR
jgi:phage terminase Nu1 subunit (DNA packaging protein)